MRILHTADWHLGHQLNGWGREEEHRLWFARLGELIVAEEIDVLLVAGDVFDGVNPSGESQRLLYETLADFRRLRPGLTTIITSGNHDPAQRLEAPAPVLRAINVHVFGAVRRRDGQLDAPAHCVSLPLGAAAPQLHVVAVPFLRPGDLPGMFDAPTAETDETETETETETGAECGGRDHGPVVAAARRFHTELAAGLREVCAGAPVILMGHLHCAGVSESPESERRIILGGEHAVPPDLFPDLFDYVALGHIHRAQNVGKGGRVRYAGSCFPLSASEAAYRHGVSILTQTSDGFEVAHHEIAPPAAFHKIPARGACSFEEMVASVAALDLDPARPVGLRPFVNITLRADRPAAVLLQEAERVLRDVPVRNAGVRVVKDQPDAQGAVPPDLLPRLSDLAPEVLFHEAFLATNGVAPDEAHVLAFRDILAREDV